MIFSGDLRVSNARGVGLVTSPGGFRWVKANRPLSLLVTSRAISFVGSSMGLIALLLYLFGLEFAVAGVSALLLVGDFLPALLAPLLGTLADRVELRRLMLICEIGQSAGTAAIAWWLPAAPLLLCLFAARAVLGQIFQPASRAAIPALVIDAELPAANAAVGFGENGIAVLGRLLAASTLPFLGIPGLLLVAAATSWWPSAPSTMSHWFSGRRRVGCYPDRHQPALRRRRTGPPRRLSHHRSTHLGAYRRNACHPPRSSNAKPPNLCREERSRCSTVPLAWRPAFHICWTGCCWQSPVRA